MRPQSRTIKYFYTFLAVTLLTIAACAGLFLFIRSNVEKATQYENEGEQRLLEEERNRSLTALAEDIKPTVEKLSDRIVPANTVPFIEMIEALGRESGAKITVDSLVPESTAGSSGKANAKNNNSKFESLRISLSAEGSWASVYQFLSLLESLPHKVAITDASLIYAGEAESADKKSTAPGESVWRGAFKFTVLKFKQ